MVVALETIAEMVVNTQGCILLSLILNLLMMSGSQAQTGRDYMSVRLESPLFMSGVSMFGREQDEYATNLTAHALMLINERGKSPEVVSVVRRMIALAMHLSPKNECAAKVNDTLKQGSMPKLIRSYYSRPVFAKLLFTRSRILAESGEQKDRQLGRYFLELSVQLSADAEAKSWHEQDLAKNGSLDWAVITGDKRG